MRSVSATYRCSECGRKYDIVPDRMLCPRCSREQSSREPLRGILEVIYEHAEGTKPEDLFPVSRESIPQLPVGNTPLWLA
jgi:DNA-directed RNA polymerase subunit RPC12/RpoP